MDFCIPLKESGQKPVESVTDDEALLGKWVRGRNKQPVRAHTTLTPESSESFHYCLFASQRRFLCFFREDSRLYRAIFHWALCSNITTTKQQSSTTTTTTTPPNDQATCHPRWRNYSPHLQPHIYSGDQKYRTVTCSEKITTTNHQNTLQRDEKTWTE